MSRIGAAVLSGSLIVAASVASEDARADVSWVDRPLTLPPFHVSADAGIGFGQGITDHAAVDGSGNVTTTTATTIGWGANLEAAVGLPFVGEVGARVGVRFGDDGIAAGDPGHFARLFDPILDEPGSGAITDPEIHVRGNLVSLDVLEIGLETRAVIPTSSGSDFELTPGVPVRVHVAGFARIDTGVWVPVEFNDDTSTIVDIPAQLFLQFGQAFFGPLTGVRFNHPGGDIPSSTDIPAGIGGGYTLGGILDLKVQVRTERINDTNWTQFIGAGVGAGLRLP